MTSRNPNKNRTINTQQEWASRKWFDYLLSSQGTDDPTAYYGHNKNGSQVYRHALLSRLLADVTCSEKVEIMIDIGCATGELTDRIHRKLGITMSLGLDFVEEAVRQASLQFPEIAFCTAKLPELPVASRSVDLVVASEVIYYLTEDGKERMLDEIHRVLRPKGRLLFCSALGDKYFSPQNAEMLITRKFVVEKRYQENLKLFNLLVYPLYVARRLRDYCEHGILPGTEISRNKLKRNENLLEMGLSKVIILVGVLIGHPIILSQTLPHFADTISRFLFPILSRSNIIIIARK